MINPKHLASLEAIAEQGSFSAAGEAVGRSHSAISLHIKALEEELDTIVIDRAARPLALTPDGWALVEQARRYRRVMEDIRAIGQSDSISGTLSVGIVPTVMSHLAPPALARIRAEHPDLQLEIRTGLSGELARAVQSGDLDAAVLTGPDLPPEDLESAAIADEPLVVIAPPNAEGETDSDLLTQHPFIWFSRKTWAGQQIERRLLDRGIRVNAAMEIDSLEAIESLVRHGLGVAIVPDQHDGDASLRRIPFCTPQATRRVVLLNRRRSPKARLIQAFKTGLRAVVRQKGSDPSETS
ncbi:MAG: LysR substrate-binding domain-containing protein [Pseudomonadota bacterium]